MGNVIAITGSEDFYRRRALATAIQEQEQKGWRVIEVDGEIPGSIVGALAQSGMLFDQQLLAVVLNPDKAELPTIELHSKTGDFSIVFLLYLEGEPKGNTKFGKFLMTLGKDHRNFAKPDKPWKQDGIAEAFCVGEANRLGVILSQALAKAVVSSTGTDLGVLSYEILKMATLAKAEGSKEISPQQARGVLAGIAQGGIPQMLEALAARDPLKLWKALSKIERTYKKDDRAVFIPRTVESRAYSWLPIVRAREQGLSVKEAAEQSGLNPWFYENKLYPDTVRWTTPEIVRLLEAMAAAERVMLQDGHEAWMYFKGKLIASCRRT